MSGDDDEKKMKFDRCYGFSFLLFPSSSRFAYFFFRPSVEK